MAPTVFRILLGLVALYAFMRGTRDERLVGLICITGAVATHLLISPLHGRFASVEIPVMVVDLAVFAGFLTVALRSSRFWPLWVAGLQLTTMLGHLLKAIDLSLLPRAYGASMTFWAYPIVLVLAVGTWRAHRRLNTQPREPQAA
jgi:hypothetical protein